MPSGAVNPIRKELTFSDINVTFTPHPITGKVPVLKNQDAVKRAIRNLILTNQYERPYEPLFGGNLLALLFENSDPFLEYRAKKQIETALRNFESRVDVQDIQVNFIEERNELDINIVFFIVNQKDPVTLNVTLERVR
jgi:phage baseplate assembly protein W